MLAAESVALTGRIARALLAAAVWLRSVRPVAVLAPLCGIQILIGAWFAFRTPHNGWIWYSGGDATEYWTAQWSLAHGLLPRGIISYGVPVYFAWVPLVAGATLIQGAAIIAPLQLVVLVPLALICLWGVADRLFGRLFAWWASLLWVLGPLLTLRGFRADYHVAFEQYFLVPHWFGMTNMADLPSLVAVLACTWATLRAVDTHAVNDAVLGGLLGGLAIGIKPANGFFLVAIAVLFVATRRWRIAAVWAIALVPALVTLALWKVRGLGTLPISSAHGAVHLAAGTGGGAGPIDGDLGFIKLGRYLGFNSHHLHAQMVDLREVFWSMRLLQFLAFAGIVGAIRRSPAKGLFVAVWFVGYCIVKASNTGDSSIPSAAYFRLAEPGLPAFLLLAASVVFLVPGLGRRVAAPATPTTAAPPVDVRRVDVRRLAPAGIVLALVPLVVVLATRPASTARTVRDENVVQEAPLSSAMHLAAVRNPDGTVTVSWRSPAVGSTRPWFVVYSSPTDSCTYPAHGAAQCVFNLPVPILTTTQALSAVDRPGQQGRWYRVALVADYRRSTVGGDLMLVSHAVHVPPS
jgi:hypothetical protein